MMIFSELLLAGRVDEALARWPHEVHEMSDGSPVNDTVGLLSALALLLAGQPDLARPWAQRARDRGAGAQRPTRPGSQRRPSRRARRQPVRGSPPAPLVASSVADLLVLRAHAVLGDASALDPLRRGVTVLAAPGLLAGLAAP